MSDDDTPPTVVIICVAVVMLGGFCIYTLCVMPFFDWLLGWGIFVGCLLLVGGITLCCRKWGDGCNGTDASGGFDFDD